MLNSERTTPPMNDHDHSSTSHHHQIPPSTRNMPRAPSTSAPPLQGLIMQRHAQQAAQQQAFTSRRGPNMSSSASIQSSITGIGGGGGGGGGGSSRIPMGGSNQQQYGMGPMVTRPFSSAHSTGSNSLTSLTPRVRDLGHGSAFNFSGGSTGSGGQSQRLNKRRRTEATPMAAHAMSPNTAFTLNQGNHSGNRGGQRWQPRDSGSFSRG